tara:strand:+ start:1779 stop:3335 length:1557 start_codon:yes stop_codon:yes gene_type:complete
MERLPSKLSTVFALACLLIVGGGAYALLRPAETRSLLGVGQPGDGGSQYARDGGLDHGVEGIKESGELMVLTVRSPTTFRLKGETISGYEVDLTMALADELGVEATYKLFEDIPSMMDAIERGEGHLAVPGLTQREIRSEADGPAITYGPAYKTVQPELVCRRDGPQPTRSADDDGISIGVVAGSGAEETLERLKEDVPQLKWNAMNVASGLTLAAEVHDETLDCAVLQSNIVSIARPLFPELQSTAYLAPEDRQLAWAIAPQSRDLEEYLKAWFQNAHQAGLLYDLDERYYGHLEQFDYVDISVFRRRIESRLPEYEVAFRDAAGENGLDWTMLAAQGYQESHWDPKAKSPTGVRGLMMLTLITAREVGVANRLDPRESIQGGALYLDKLYDRLPNDIVGYDRLWLAIAAYNVGYGHLLDARRLARREGLDPNKWRNIKEMLPRLTEKRYYSTVPYGYARGYEPVKYVARIREYDDVLTNRVPDPEQPPFRPAEIREASRINGEDIVDENESGAGTP